MGRAGLKHIFKFFEIKQKVLHEDYYKFILNSLVKTNFENEKK